MPNTRRIGSPPKGHRSRSLTSTETANLDIRWTGSGLGVCWCGLGNGDEAPFGKRMQYTRCRWWLIGTGSVGDFDGDGTELVVANGSRITKPGQQVCDGYDHKSTIGRGDGTFEPPTSYRTVFAPESLAVGDLTEMASLIWLSSATDQSAVWSTPNGARVSILLGNGDGIIPDAVEDLDAYCDVCPDYDPRFYRWRSAIFDLDGLLDAFVWVAATRRACWDCRRRLPEQSRSPSRRRTLHYPVVWVRDCGCGQLITKSGKPGLATANWEPAVECFRECRAGFLRASRRIWHDDVRQ